VELLTRKTEAWLTLDWIANTPINPNWLSDPDGFGRDPVTSHRVVCRDGTVLSVQASHSHYCTPKNNDGPWTSLEVMIVELPPFTKENGREIDPRWSWFGNEYEGIYGWVPAWFLLSEMETSLLFSL